MGIEEALHQYEVERWSEYNGEHDEDGIGWISDEEEEQKR